MLRLSCRAGVLVVLLVLMLLLATPAYAERDFYKILGQ